MNARSALAAVLQVRYDDAEVEVTADRDGFTAHVSGPSGYLVIQAGNAEHSAILRHGLGIDTGRERPRPAQRKETR